MKGCTFCKIIANERRAHNIWEDENHLAFLDINPIKPGHTLLVPKHHVDYIFNMDKSELCEIFDRACKLSRPLMKVTSAQRVGLVVEGFEVPHVHVHLVPIHQDNELNPEKGMPAADEELNSMARKIREFIASEGQLSC